MAGAQDLHQIEYRHHQTKDLSPVATSMTSRESLAAWDSRIRAWVRHPHDDRLSESACYQVFANGQAALAWRYWDERAASRTDGSRGRPLVSRVLVGPAGVLTFPAALAACRAGLSDAWAGPLPGQVPDGSDLPMVRGEALTALLREMTPELDKASAAEDALQAVVAAALAEPSIPLAISLADALIQAPLRECVQCPLLWGLYRVTWPLLGLAGRDWSFSTFELALGEMDPGSLPGIVVRTARDGVKAPPSRWRREAKVRPFEPSALDDETPYAALLELAGWLVAEYRKRGGDGMEQIIAGCGAGAGPFTLRMDRLTEALRTVHQPPGAAGRRKSGERRGARAQAGAAMQEDSTTGAVPAAAPPAGFAQESARTGMAPVEALGGTPMEAVSASPMAVDPPPADPRRSADLRYLESTSQPTVLLPTASAGPPPPLADPAQNADPVQGGPAVARAGDAGPASMLPHADYAQDRYQLSPGPSAPSGRGQQSPPPPGHDRGGPVANARPAAARDWFQPRGGQYSASALLRQVELLGEDQEQFEAMLDTLYRYRAGDITPEECARSWDVISSDGWYDNVCRNNSFRSKDLARIFWIVVIPTVADDNQVEAIARWARQAPVPMIDGLLDAAKAAGREVWEWVMDALEPTLAYRWLVENFAPEHWDRDRVLRPIGGPGRGTGAGGIRKLMRRPGKR